jgi:hypothetical protein
MTIIELEGICPSRKIRIATVSQYMLSENRKCATVIERLSLQIFFCPMYIVFGMVENPWMIEGRVVRNEIQQELQAMISEPVPELEEGFVSSKILVDNVGADSKRGSGYVLFRKVG